MGEDQKIQIGQSTIQLSAHESGRQMLVLFPFHLELLDRQSLSQLLQDARARYPGEIGVVRVCLEPDQRAELEFLQQQQFNVDGYEFGFDKTALLSELGEQRVALPAGYAVAMMDYNNQIDAVAAMEKQVHALDPSSRVDFSTPEAEQGMREYYRRACGGEGVFVLSHNEELAGYIGFMPDSDRPGAVHVSSVAIAPDHQGRGLFFPILFSALAQSRFADLSYVTGVTTTAKLLAMAERYPIESVGVSLSRDWSDELQLT